VADFDTALMQQVFNVAERQGKSNIHHYCQADNLRAGFEVAEWGVHCHPAKLRNHPARLKLVSSDKTPIRISTKVLNPFSSNLHGKQRAKPAPPETDSFVADVDAALVQQVFHISK
jgi:hypothetical protein